MSHASDLASAAQHYSDAIEHEAALWKQVGDLEAANADLQAKLTMSRQVIAEQAARIKELEEAQPVPEANWIVHETFQKPLDPAKYIFLCHKPELNFKWIEPGSLDVIFIAGKTTGTAVSSASGKVLRSELEWRKPGTAADSEIALSIPTGEGYTLTLDVTIPADYDPAVSSSPNEKRTLLQLWESKEVAPWAVELIKPSLAPWNGTTNVLRVVAAGAVRWIQPVEVGKRYRLKLAVTLSRTAGSLRVNMNGTDYPEYVGATTYGVASAMVPHFGVYEAGSDNDPVGATTVIRFHEVGIA